MRRILLGLVLVAAPIACKKTPADGRLGDEECAALDQQIVEIGVREHLRTTSARAASEVAMVEAQTRADLSTGARARIAECPTTRSREEYDCVMTATSSMAVEDCKRLR